MPAMRTIAHLDQGGVAKVTVVLFANGVVTSICGNRRDEKVVVGDDLLQRGHPVVEVVPVAPLAFRGVLPIADALNQVLLEVFPVIVPELRQRQRQPERPSLPFEV
ncbi:MAG: hypothetical protein QOC62_2535, partial [Mycobacterium sp.]|nr:hypothetical protein [Mycobacterium sp.]